jgi:hypothetical protein
MSQEMPFKNEPKAPAEVFQRLEATVAKLRAAATAPPDPPKSWMKRTFHPDASSSPQSESNASLVDALAQMVSALGEIAEGQEMRLEKLAKELSELSESLDAVRRHSDAVESQLRSIAANVKGLHERAAALETELAQSREQGSKEKHALGDEMRERIENVLNEQRVCIRQLSLQASEEAVLADRARRATELKLEELARRVAPPPA